MRAELPWSSREPATSGTKSGPVPPRGPGMESVLIISPDFPPKPGGVSDHTVQLARALAAHSPVLIASSTGTADFPQGTVAARIADWSKPAELCRAIDLCPAPTTLVWQYVPQMYGRGGVCPAIPQVVTRCQEQGRQQILLAHEICSPWSWWPHRAYYAWAHRRQWRTLAQSVDRVGFSTEAWLLHWRQTWPWLRDKSVLTPSPSNIAVQACPPDHASRWRQALDIPSETLVIAFFGTLGVYKQWDWVEASWRQVCASGQAAALVAIGGKPILRESPPPGGCFRALGYLDEPAVSHALQAADILALPFADGVSERRTTFMAGLSHGCAILTTTAHSTGPSLRTSTSFAAAPVEQPRRFAQALLELAQHPTRRTELGMEAKELYRREYDWPVVIQRLKQDLPSPWRPAPASGHSPQVQLPPAR